MITPEETLIALPEGAPRVRLLADRSGDLGQTGLRACARAVTAASGTAYASRSYRFPYALIACHEQPVGIDIERIEALDSPLPFLVSISTPAELQRPVDRAQAGAYATSLWCSKEALAKALGDAVAYEPRRLNSPMSWPDGRSGPWHALALPVAAGYTAWLCWRSASSGIPRLRQTIAVALAG